VEVATNAELVLGAGKPYDSLLGVFWGTGIGGGIVLTASSGSVAVAPARSGTW
jgi:predicted NBD/HSP70 family sugar kinase